MTTITRGLLTVAEAYRVAGCDREVCVEAACQAWTRLSTRVCQPHRTRATGSAPARRLVITLAVAASSKPSLSRYVTPNLSSGSSTLAPAGAHGVTSLARVSNSMVGP